MSLTTRLPVSQWLESPYLERLAGSLIHRFGLQADYAEDLLQEIRLALWRAGCDRNVNSTWVFHTGLHKVVDLIRSDSKRANPREPQPPASGDAELWHLLRARMSSLPSQLQRFCHLRYEEGLSQAEISRYFCCCRASVRWMDTQSLRALSGSPQSSSAKSRPPF
jgi:DNA-directed RNA polymerase specialized sigma24 family protein